MDQYEQAILDYINGPPERFINPQYTIPFDGLTGGSCPDFVVLDLRCSTIYVVEVTAAADTKRVIPRVHDRESRWFTPLREYLKGLNPIFENWRYRVTLFVRGEEEAHVKEAVAQLPDVSVVSLDRAVFSWRWKWTGQRPDNPLE
jgi:hypothetical protein